MGFLDFLRGGGEKPVEICFEEVEDHVRKRLVEARSGREKRFEGQVDEVLGHVDNLGELLDILESKKRDDDLDERLARIDKTNKPRYLETMRSALADIRKAACGEPQAAVDEFMSLMDNLGKANYSDGRYLVFVYGKAVERVHGESKRLLESVESLKAAVEDTAGEKTLGKVLTDYREYVDFTGEALMIDGEIERLGEGLERIEAEAQTLQGRNALLEKEAAEGEISDLRMLEEEYSREKQVFEQGLRTSFGGLKRLLKKFRRKHAAELRGHELIIQDPINYYRRFEAGEIRDFLARLGKTVETEDLKVDRKKAASRIGLAAGYADETRKKEYVRLSNELRETRERLESHRVFREIEELKRACEGLDKEIRVKTDLMETLKGKKKGLLDKAGKRRESIVADLRGIGILVKD